jgi:alpha-beta hydrolase superfamily lysophospholipase
MAKNTLRGIGWGFEHAADWHLPVLFMHGDQDQIAFVRGSQEFTGKISGDCTLKIWPGLYHETHNEPEKDQVFAFLLDWLEKHLKQ